MKENEVQVEIQVMLEREMPLPFFSDSVTNRLIQNPKSQGGRGAYQEDSFYHSWPLSTRIRDSHKVSRIF